MTGLAFDCSGPTGTTPVIFLHAGITGRTMRYPQWQDLTREHDVLRLDLRGFGEPDARPFVKWSHHRAGIETLNSLGIDAVHAIGSSLGAGVAVASPWPHPGSSGRSCSRVRAVPHRRPEARAPSVRRRRECGADGPPGR